jgi:hypothetical protein
MTATPHNGKEEDFQLFSRCWIPTVFTASLDGAHKVDVSDLMRRMVKKTAEVDGTKLFLNAAPPL